MAFEPKYTKNELNNITTLEYRPSSEELIKQELQRTYAEIERLEKERPQLVKKTFAVIREYGGRGGRGLGYNEFFEELGVSYVDLLAHGLQEIANAMYEASDCPIKAANKKCDEAKLKTMEEDLERYKLDVAIYKEMFTSFETQLGLLSNKLKHTEDVVGVTHDALQEIHHALKQNEDTATDFIWIISRAERALNCIGNAEE